MLTARKLLIIEDDTDLAEAVGKKFGNVGFEVIYATGGRQGAELVASEQPDVILLDLNLPDVDGIDVCRHIRHQSAVPIVIITARTEEAARVAGLEIGADDYVTKPFSLNELVARIRALLRRSQGALLEGGLGTVGPTSQSPAAETAQPEILSAVGVNMDVAARRVLIDGREVSLTRTEFCLLQTLLENVGKVVNQHQLLEICWDSDKVDTHLVEVHIANLRAKIEDDSQSPQRVRTVRGFGYRVG